MKTYELMLEVRRLAAVKAKNEQAIPQEQLQGRYRQAYEKLCEELKDKQCELRTRYMRTVQQLSKLMSDSVYVEPGTEMQWLHDEMVRRSDECEKDALVKTLFLAFSIFFEGEGMQ